MTPINPPGIVHLNLRVSTVVPPAGVHHNPGISSVTVTVVQLLDAVSAAGAGGQMKSGEEGSQTTEVVQLLDTVVSTAGAGGQIKSGEEGSQTTTGAGCG